MINVKKADAIRAYHFTDGMQLRNGQPLINGKLYWYKKPICMCVSGYHASRKLENALGYAPGTHLSKVLCYGEVWEDTDKLVCSKRISTVTINITDLILEYFYTARADFIQEIQRTHGCKDIKELYIRLSLKLERTYYRSGTDDVDRRLCSKCRFTLLVDDMLMDNVTEKKLINVFINFPNVYPELKYWFFGKIDELFRLKEADNG